MVGGDGALGQEPGVGKPPAFVSPTASLPWGLPSTGLGGPLSNFLGSPSSALWALRVNGQGTLLILSQTRTGSMN